MNKYFSVLTFFILILGLRGIVGAPQSKELISDKWREYGPLELSPERGRFALLYSLIEDRSFQLSADLTKFSEPDVAFINGKFVSLFAPGLTFFSIPGYLLGKIFNISQAGAFSTVLVFALMNFLILRAISLKMGASLTSANLSSFAFIFGTPAFTYAVSFYQHHLSLFLLLSAIYLLIKSKNIWSDFAIWTIFGFSFLVDYPNLAMFLPVAVFAFFRFFELKTEGKNQLLTIKFFRLFSIFASLIPLLILFWFNQNSYDNPFQLSATLETTKDIEIKKENPNFLQNEEKKEILDFFNLENLSNGLYIHLFSSNRGVVFFAPVSLIGIIGAILAYKKKNPYIFLFLSIILVNLLLYSLWGDPWGGWAFGSRYLIPSYAMLSIFLSLALTYWSKKIFFLFLFWILFVYSTTVNSLGALTSSKNPPIVEISSLEKITGQKQRYSFDRNWDYLLSKGSKSFIYQTYLKDFLKPEEYFLFIAGVINILGLVLIALNWKSSSKDKIDLAKKDYFLAIH